MQKKAFEDFGGKKHSLFVDTPESIYIDTTPSQTLVFKGKGGDRRR